MCDSDAGGTLSTCVSGLSQGKLAFPGGGEREGGERESAPTLSQALSMYQKNLIPLSSQPYENRIITFLSDLKERRPREVR